MDIEKVIKLLKGQKCWRAWDGFPPAIFFECGYKIPRHNNTSPRRGEFSLGFMGCSWQLLDKKNNVLAKPDFEKENILSEIKSFEGDIVKEVLINLNKEDSDEIIFESGKKILADNKSDQDKYWAIIGPKYTVSIYKDNIKIEKND